jgi:hypothetical protein
VRQHRLDVHRGARRLHAVVRDDTLVVRVEQPPMEACIEGTCFRELLAKGSMDPGVLAEASALVGQQRFCDVEHGVVRSGGGEIIITSAQQHRSRLYGTRRFLEQLRGLAVHAGLASSLALARKAVSPASQSASDTNTRLMLTPYFSERSDTAGPVARHFRGIRVESLEDDELDAESRPPSPRGPCQPNR